VSYSYYYSLFIILEKFGWVNRLRWLERR